MAGTSCMKKEKTLTVVVPATIKVLHISFYTGVYENTKKTI
ncbi:hypothetical protein CLOSTHATH_02362 [Hungatella hathewayi DSM 13479]|uniref:Uncharacterized protein n=1 Tax=Hungatella hathewayi DSM 13479 TaxID=566550 RepID=D3AFH8_9FIRM|nr:hypothetical protein CLOSTHATH_02362 [Hungatella hathewayi DSM 13479]